MLNNERFNNCKDCKRAGKTCQMIVVPTLHTIMNLETAINRSLSYLNKEKTPQIKINLTCLNFIKKGEEE